MGYYDIIPKKSTALFTIKKNIHINSIVTLCHGIIVFFWIICTSPWPSDLRDAGFYVLLNFLIYLFIINLLNCLFMYDEGVGTFFFSNTFNCVFKYLESTSENEEYGPIFNFCKTFRHILFWIYGFYVQFLVIMLGLHKLITAIEFELYGLYVPRTCFLIWSVICFSIDVHYLMKTCVYHQIINAETKNTDQYLITVESNK